MGLFSYFADSFTDLSKPGFKPSEIELMEQVSMQYALLVNHKIIRDPDNVTGKLYDYLPIIKRKDFYDISPEELGVVYECFGIIKDVFYYIANELNNEDKGLDALKMYKISENALDIRTKIISPKLHELYDKEFKKQGI